jgi:hypothetical protein
MMSVSDLLLFLLSLIIPLRLLKFTAGGVVSFRIYVEALTAE